MSGLVDADMHYEQLWFVIEQRDELVAELKNLLAEANESLNDTRVWL